MSKDEGWTHVKRKFRRNAPAPSHTLPDTFAPRTAGVFRSSDALRQDYDKIQAQWMESSAHETLLNLLQKHAKGLKVKRVVCLGIGTFDPEDGAWEAKRAAYVQLCALSTLTSQLEKHNKGYVECIFQEPIFTSSDTAFLTTLGHQIIPSPQAYSLIDHHTILFAVHLYRPIYAAALKDNLPAIFIGTGWDVWDTVTMEKSDELANMKKMDETYTRHAFPQDAASTAFSSTSIYFMPRAAVTSEETSDKDAVEGEESANAVPKSVSEQSAESSEKGAAENRLAVKESAEKECASDDSAKDTTDDATENADKEAVEISGKGKDKSEETKQYSEEEVDRGSDREKTIDDKKKDGTVQDNADISKALRQKGQGSIHNV